MIGITSDPSASLKFWKIGMIFVSLIPALLIHLILLVCGIPDTKSKLAFPYLFGCIGGILAVLGPMHTEVIPFGDFHYVKATPVYMVYFPIWLTLVFLGHYILWKYSKRALGVDKRRMQLMLVALLIGFMGGAMNFLPMFGLNVYPWGNFAIPISALIQSFAVFVYGLFDVRIIIRRTLIYSLLAALITSAYLVVVLIMERWFQGFFGYRSVLATAFVAFLTSIFFDPLRHQIQALIDRAWLNATPFELAEQRDQLLAEVRKSMQMKSVGTLAAGLAHEIRNPLASIKTFTEYLDSKYDDPDFRNKFTKIVGGEVERINLIVQQLLDFAKPLPPRLAPLSICDVVDGTLELLNGEFVKRRVEIVRQYQSRAMILGDPQQLRQVFVNLFLNSLHATNGSGRIDICVQMEKGDLLIVVKDNGSGIEPESLPRIFEPFYTTKPEGSGLGLAVVYGIVREHRGQIQVRSKVNQGTEIRIRFPACANLQK